MGPWVISTTATGTARAAAGPDGAPPHAASRRGRAGEGRTMAAKRNASRGGAVRARTGCVLPARQAAAFAPPGG